MYPSFGIRVWQTLVLMYSPQGQEMKWLLMFKFLLWDTCMLSKQITLSRKECSQHKPAVTDSHRSECTTHTENILSTSGLKFYVTAVIPRTHVWHTGQIMCISSIPSTTDEMYCCSNWRFLSYSSIILISAEQNRASAVTQLVGTSLFAANQEKLVPASLFISIIRHVGSQMFLFIFLNIFFYFLQPRALIVKQKKQTKTKKLNDWTN